MIKLFLVILCSICLLGCAAKTSSPADIHSHIRAVMEAEDRPPFSGVIILDVGKNRLMDTVQGHEKIPVTMHQQFMIADLSKQITAAIILRLSEQGKLNLHAPIQNYLPELSSFPWGKQVTTHQLLTHTSGMGEGKNPSVMPNHGKQFKYSHAGYDLLGKLASRVELKTFPQLVADITKMCGMKHTIAHERGDAKFFQKIYPHFIEGWTENKHGKFKQKFIPRDPVQDPSLGIMSTPEDMIKWSKCLHGGDLLSDTSYHSMTSSFVKKQHRWGDMGYGYGLQVAKTYGFVELSHSGSIPGFKATMIHYPYKEINLLILENISLHHQHTQREFELHDQLRKVIVDRILTPPV